MKLKPRHLLASAAGFAILGSAAWHLISGQYGQRFIETRGRTLMLPHLINNSFEICISAYNEKGNPATLYVDDVSISDRPLTTPTPAP